MRTCLIRVCLDAMLLPQSYWYPNLSEGADSVGGQLRGDKVECSFSGVTNSGRCLEAGAGKRCSRCVCVCDQGVSHQTAISRLVHHRWSSRRLSCGHPRCCHLAALRMKNDLPSPRSFMTTFWGHLFPSLPPVSYTHLTLPTKTLV